MKYIYTQEFFNIENVKPEFCDRNNNLQSIPMEYDKQERHWFCECANNMSNGVAKSIKKAAYTLDRPLDIYAGADIAHVKGLHSLTYVCFQPDGSIYKLEECSIGQFEKNEADYEVVFRNHIVATLGRAAEGMWSFQIFLDGKSVVKDYFVLKRKVISAVSRFQYGM